MNKHERAFLFLGYILSLTSAPCKQIKSMRKRSNKQAAHGQQQ